MSLIRKIINPLLKLLIKLGRYPHRSGETEKSPEEKLEEKIDSLELAGAEKVENLEEDEKKMIHSIFELGRTSVKEIMVPRIDMCCVEENASLEEFKEVVRKRGHSRIPIFRDSIDQITGVVYVKDLFLEERKEKLDLRKFSHKPFFVPENKKIDELLQEMRKEKIHLAVVVDEYGGTAGLVTLEDILEEIVGEIEDEYDKGETAIQRMGEDEYKVAAKLSIHDLNEALGVELPEKEFETVGGLIYDLVGGVPEEGRTLEYRGLTFQAERVKGQRIVKVRIRKVRSEIEDEK